MSYVIDFGSLGGNVLSGRARGETVRAAQLLEEKERDPNFTCTVEIPDHIKVISASFMLGLFDKSIQKYKSKEVFLQHYNFRPGERKREVFNADLEYVIMCALADRSAPII